MILSLILCFGLLFLPMLFAQEKKKETQELSLEDLLNTKIDTAAKYEQTVWEAAASVTIITSEEISRFGWETLAEVLANIKGSRNDT